MKKLLLTLCVALSSVCASAITIDDLCGLYTRHIDNVSTGGMGAALIADTDLQITKKDDTTIVLSKLFVMDGYPVEGVVDFASNTVTFAPGQSVGVADIFPQTFANSWGGVPDEEPIIGTIGEDGVITIGNPDEAYAGFCVTLPTGATIFQAQGIITLTPNKTVLWTANATFKLGEGDNIAGEAVLTACAPSLGYDYTISIGDWGHYDLQLKANEDGSLSLYNADLCACVTDTIFWWMKWYADFNYDYAYDYLWIETVGENGEALSGVSGNADGGSIWFMAEYAAYNSDNDEDAPVVYEPETRFTITWGTPQEDAVEGIKADNADNAIYNMAGQRVERPTKGIFIQNGKKIRF